MEFNIIRPRSVGATNTNSSIWSNKVRFGSLQTTDAFNSASVSKYISEDYIKSSIASNPELKKILKEIGASGKLNMAELQELSKKHAKDTQDIASGIINNLPKGLKEHVNVKSVKDAAYLHDIGKVLIPPEILNKSGKLTPAESEIMHRHSEIGYELLKNSDIDTRTLHLVKYHHQNASHSGYPKVKDDFWADINLQILSLADRYSALTEKRVYKEALPKERALNVLYKSVVDGNTHPFVYKALLDYVNSGATPYDKLAVSVI